MDGKAVSAEALIAHLSQLSRESGRALLVQEALQNSTWLDAVAGRAFATTRIITLLDETEEPEVVYAALRTAGSAESIVDNYHALGVAFPLDIETGELGAGRRLLFADDPQFYPAHPTTGARMQATRLARWQDAKALAIRLHRRCRQPGANQQR